MSYAASQRLLARFVALRQAPAMSPSPQNAYLPYAVAGYARRRAGCDVSSTAAWPSGAADIPPKPAAWIETLASYDEGAEDLEVAKSLDGKAAKVNGELKHNLLTLSFSAFLTVGVTGRGKACAI